jgi:S-formylglutathione hydrolase
MSATVELHEVESKAVGNDVPIAVITPPGFEPEGDALPLCIALHGGGEDRSSLAESVPMFEEMWSAGLLPPMVLVSASTGPLSWYAGPWEDFIADELPEFMATRFRTRTDAAGIVLTGVSMGGMGTLKIGLRRPDRFAAIAAMEPGIDPGFEHAAATPRNTFNRFTELEAELWGDPIDEARWQHDNPANIARDNADAIRASGLEIYLECGDEDGLNLHDGAEFMHRALWDLDIRHEYHLVRWAGHVGPSFNERMPEVMGFLANALAGGKSCPLDADLNADELTWIEWYEGGMQGDPVFVDMMSERGPALLERTMADKKAVGRAADPEFARAYGRMPQ